MSTMQQKLSATRAAVPTAVAGAAPTGAPFELPATLAALCAAQLAGTVAILAVLTGLAGFRRDGVTAVLAAWLAAAPQSLVVAHCLHGLSALSQNRGAIT
jgi:hypothetical protein